jgi:hypothetical protein
VQVARSPAELALRLAPRPRQRRAVALHGHRLVFAVHRHPRRRDGRGAGEILAQQQGGAAAGSPVSLADPPQKIGLRLRVLHGEAVEFQRVRHAQNVAMTNDEARMTNQFQMTNGRMLNRNAEDAPGAGFVIRTFGFRIWFVIRASSFVIPFLVFPD